MAQFEYKAKSRDGATRSGQIEAADRRAAISAVERLSLVPLTITQLSESAKANAKRNAARRKSTGKFSLKLARPNHMSMHDTLLFTGELCDLLEGGMTLGNALNCLAARGDGESGPTQVIGALRDAIIEGANFSSALEKFPKAFPPSMSTWSEPEKPAAP